MTFAAELLLWSTDLQMLSPAWWSDSVAADSALSSQSLCQRHTVAEVFGSLVRNVLSSGWSSFASPVAMMSLSVIWQALRFGAILASQSAGKSPGLSPLREHRCTGCTEGPSTQSLYQQSRLIRPTCQSAHSQPHRSPVESPVQSCPHSELQTIEYCLAALA